MEMIVTSALLAFGHERSSHGGKHLTYDYFHYAAKLR